MSINSTIDKLATRIKELEQLTELLCKTDEKQNEAIKVLADEMWSKE